MMTALKTWRRPTIIKKKWASNRRMMSTLNIQDVVKVSAHSIKLNFR